MSSVSPKPQPMARAPVPAPNKSQGPNKAPGTKRILPLLALLVLVAAASFWLWQTAREAPRHHRTGLSSDSVQHASVSYAQDLTPSLATEAGPGSGQEVSPASESRDRASSLLVTANVRGAAVFLNGQRVGKTPHRLTPLKPGEYRLRVEKTGYEPVEKEVRVADGEATVEVTLKQMKATAAVGPSGGATKTGAPTKSSSATKSLAALKETVSVKHEHRFGLGSCEGVLRASAAGIRYETEHKDAFSVPLSAMEQLNLKKKSLNLKLRGGRSYNFTEINGDIHALAEFHQRVAHAVQARGEAPGSP